MMNRGVTRKHFNLTFIITIVCLVSMKINGQENQKHNYVPKDGYVVDAETAINIAIAVWNPIYGKNKISKEKPYKAILKEGIWYVTGSLPEGTIGGVAEAEISKDSGCIMRISHGK